MELPPEAQPFPGPFSGPFAYVIARASNPSVRLATGLGALYGLAGGLLGGLQVLGAALAIALNQQEIARYQQQYAAYQECLRTTATASLCQPPTAGALAVNTIWALFLGVGLVAFALAQVANGRAARAATARTGSRGTGIMAALIAGIVGWLLYLAASVISVLTQASPFTMTAPPLGVEASTLHLGAAIGYAIVDSLALAPTLGVAGVAGLIGAQLGRRAAGPSSYVVVSYGPPLAAVPPMPLFPPAPSAQSTGERADSLSPRRSLHAGSDRAAGV